jgi:hypothetical protein
MDTPLLLALPREAIPLHLDKGEQALKAYKAYLA